MAAPASFRRLFILALCLAAVCAAVEENELDSVLTVLRARGYTLFSNAIATSDVVYEIVNSNSSFTFFAPTDSSLFALDMANTASDYTTALRCHVVPLRLSFNELRRFPSGYSLRTLAKNRRIQIGNRRSNALMPAGDEISIDLVRLISPGLFYSRHIAVHGLGGILRCSNSSDRPPEMNRRRHAPRAHFTSHRRHHATTRRLPTAANSSNDTVGSPPSVQPGSASYGAHSPETVHFPTDHNIPTASTLSPRSEPPAYSPEIVQFPPAYNIWPGIPTASTFPLRIEPPAPEFSENDDPTAYPPEKERDELSMMGVDREEEEREIALIHSISPADLTAILETELAQSQPSNEKIYYDCPANAGFEHVMSRDYCSST